MPNLTPDQHAEASHRAKVAADRLCLERQAWFVVPLFYSAMHHVLRDLKQRPDVPVEMRTPEHHDSHWKGGRQIWGTNQVVPQVYPSSTSKAYGKLFQAAYNARYGAPIPWEDTRREERNWEQIKRDLPG